MSAERIKSGKNNNLRPFEKVPIFVVEDHNDVLQFVYRCLGARRIPFTSNKIIHFDSHPDMTIPKSMPAEFVRDKEKLLDTLSIENWLMPTAYAGHIEQLIWMKPHWATQIADGDYEFSIGDHAGYIRCDSPLEYFLGEGTYQPKCNLNNQRLINLRVFTLDDPLITGQQQQPSQSRQVEFQNCVDEANDGFILDIDLDFFSTANPFKKMLEEGVYTDLKRLFKADFFESVFDSKATEDDLVAFTKRRSGFLDALENVFQQLDRNIAAENLAIADNLEKCKVQIFDLIRDVKKQHPNNEIAWQTIFDAGCTFDSNELPHHISSEQEIERLIAIFKQFLESFRNTPSIITISRSSEDDYCPAEQVEFIQQLVLGTIYRVYGDRVNQKPILFYRDENWSV
ncbi:UPF0489 protein C5orf22 [Sitodiplosis mosellana]|uniref:UPF0489 protein C5orf22 n=1 Tax=Sitodiplosis mosellana TaxID=263140 RepID=UPI002443C829|nr:UPF0489 protein C5orf22 [Sitodiplosis mosellana]XP_055317047.1 UPF0489 protein C5orf22 [Sitodiplosis mosellana]